MIRILIIYFLLVNVDMPLTLATTNNNKGVTELKEILESYIDRIYLLKIKNGYATASLGDKQQNNYLYTAYHAFDHKLHQMDKAVNYDDVKVFKISKNGILKEIAKVTKVAQSKIDPEIAEIKISRKLSDINTPSSVKADEKLKNGFCIGISELVLSDPMDRKEFGQKMIAKINKLTQLLKQSEVDKNLLDNLYDKIMLPYAQYVKTTDLLSGVYSKRAYQDLKNEIFKQAQSELNPPNNVYVLPIKNTRYYVVVSEAGPLKDHDSGFATNCDGWYGFSGGSYFSSSGKLKGIALGPADQLGSFFRGFSGVGNLKFSLTNRQ